MNLRNLLIIMVLISLFSCETKDKEENTMESTKAIDPVNMNTDVKPGEDFFVYANGGWMQDNPIPQEYSRFGAFEVLDKKSKEQIKEIITEVSTLENLEKNSPKQQIRDFYKAAMDTNRINELGVEPIQPLLDKINNISNKEDLFNSMIELSDYGVSPGFYLFASIDEKNSTRYIPYFMQGGLGLPDRDYYTEDNARFKEIKKKYVEHISKMFDLADVKNSEAKAESILEFETNFAEASMTRLEMRTPSATYHLHTFDSINDKFTNFGFVKYLRGVGIENIEEANVMQPEFLDTYDKMFAEVDLDTWKAYLKWNVINSNANLLSKDFEEANFAFFGTELSGKEKMQKRWKRVINSINGSLGEAVGKIYVEKYFPPEAKNRMEDLVANLRISLKESIKNLDWMQAETKEKALEKLGTMNLKVGYPDKWKDYSSVEITEFNYVQNVWNARKFRKEFNYNKIGKPIDEDEWGMTPQTVNAYYSPNRNEIVFPAAILQPPFFNMNADDAVNYGAIGVVIGHEMTHGFDDQGRKYDKDGNLTDWWTEEDAKQFEEKTKVLVDQFNNYSILDTMFIDGELTLGENIADNGGLYVSYNALLKSFEGSKEPEDIDGMNWKQRFFISYAQVWRQNIRDKELMRRLKEDVHSPGEARVNGGVVNLPYFYEAFEISENDPLYVKPENRAKIW